MSFLVRLVLLFFFFLNWIIRHISLFKIFENSSSSMDTFV